MTLFRNYTFTWQQVTLFKFYLVIAGLVIGAYCRDLVMEWLTPLAIVWVILLIYFVHAMLKKKI